MTAIVALLDDGRGAPNDDRVRRMLAAMPRRGDADRAMLAPTAHGTLAASTLEWESILRAGAPLARRGPVTVVADATLYHRADLVRALGLPREIMPGDADLILAAWERWGIDAFTRLEGEFAAVVLDTARGMLVAARDFSGARTLFTADDGRAVASTVGGLLADPSVPRTLDLGAIATAAAGLWGHAAQTAYRAISEIPAGQLLQRSVGRGQARTELRTFWTPPTRIMVHRAPRDDAAEELRALLVDAVRERAAPEGPTALSLSGGWDSTAVGAAATLALGRDGPQRLAPVSFSYPPGDPGREDELIRDVVGHWGIETAWLDVDAVPLVRGARDDASARELPFAHAYTDWNRALARQARALGARVLLDGVGGDQLFQVSDIHLADLFASGQWLSLARQWRARRGRGARAFWRWAVRPTLPDRVVHALARWRGLAPPGHHMDRLTPNWMVPGFLAAHDVPRREREARPELPRGNQVLGEAHAYLRFPFFARILGLLRDLARAEGVALRSPLLDDRVVRFAVQRPWSDRADGAETKVLLRRAMHGLLPERVLAPRPHRTGITSAYFLRHLRDEGRPLVDAILQDSLLASIGMIDLTHLRRAWAHVLEHDHDELAVRILFTLHTELWVRAHADDLPTREAA